MDSFVVSALQDAGGYAISRQNNLELHLGCHTCWLSYFTLVCLCCGRTVSRAVGRWVYSHVITKFSRMGRLLHFLTHGVPLGRLAREGSANNLLLHFSRQNNDLLVLKQWKCSLNRIMPSLLGLLKHNDLALRARLLFLRRPWSSGIILYVKYVQCDFTSQQLRKSLD